MASPPRDAPVADGDDDVWEAINEGTAGVRRELCAKGSEALERARADYEALAVVAEALEDTASPDEFNRRAAALYGHACLAIGRADEPLLDLTMTTGIEAKTYWESGLGSWFQAYLDLADGSDETIWLLPSRPSVVTGKTHPEDPLAPWMCPPDPESPCAGSVTAWRSRAERYYELWSNAGGIEIADCSATVENGPAEDAYARWRTCEQGSLRRHASLPVGGLGAIDDGWIVVYGRRGHYRYCDEVAVFDLASGSHYRFAECDHRPEVEGLVKAGAVGSRSAGVDVGRITPDLLREFAWATMSVRYVQADVIAERALGRQLPPGVKVSRADNLSLSGVGLSGGGSSGQTRLGWIWTRGSGDTPAHGELTWPSNLSDPAEDHAVRLLAIAELRRSPGCAAADLPGWIIDNLSEGLPESEHELVDPPSEAIREAMRRQVKRGRCAK